MAGACTEGEPLLEPLREDDERRRGVRVRLRGKHAAFVQHPAVPAGRAKRSPCLVSGRCVMGYGVAARVGAHAYRFAEWVPIRRRDVRGSSAWRWEGEWGRAAAELYNLSDGGEARNVAGVRRRPLEDVEAALRARLRAHVEQQLQEQEPGRRS